MEFKKFGGYRIGTNIPFQKGAVWENVARASRWGAPVIELNTDAHRLGQQGLDAIKQQAKANDLVYTWHIPPSAQQSGELAVPNDPKQNEFARLTMQQAIKSALDVEARHITFHGTLSAGRPAPDQLYVYDEQQKQVGMQRLIEGMNREDMIKMLDESKKAQVRTQMNSMKSQQELINGMIETSEAIEKGIDEKKAAHMAYLVVEASRYGQIARVQPEHLPTWSRIQEKAIRNQPLNAQEMSIVKDYSSKVKEQVKDYQTQINASMQQLKPLTEKEHLVRDGEAFMIDNAAKNVAQAVSTLDPQVLDRAIKNKMSLGFENLPGNQLFSTPQELNQLRDSTIKHLVSMGKVSKKQAEQLIGFTFDFAHANTTKYFEINGKKFASPSEFVDQLKGPVRHVHATDSFGAVDGHLPLGQGEMTREEFAKIEESLKRNGFRGTTIHELGGAELPVLYGSSMEWVEGGGYMVGNTPTSSMWGPSYMAASMTDPLMMERDKGYFYESFADIY